MSPAVSGTLLLKHLINPINLSSLQFLHQHLETGSRAIVRENSLPPVSLRPIPMVFSGLL